ncbi:UNVERIFIED_CONTAM: hypothetical protein FKN15_010298 [Acipenser sinensis]
MLRVTLIKKAQIGHSLAGIEKFGGQYFHSRDYKSPQEFQGKRVLVIGIGNSGGDIAVEMSGVAEQVFLSTRRGSWVLNRVSDNGFPGDMMYNTRITALLRKYLHSSLLNWIGEKKINTRFDHSLYGLQPEHRLFSQHPMVNDDLPNRILSGRVQVKPNVSEFRSVSVVFQDGSVEDRIDVVVFATGYTFSFPFLDDSVLAVADNQVSLYKYVFPPALERTTLAVIGLIQPLGAIMPISELQARWATRVFAELQKLPPEKTMLKDIENKKKAMAKRYVLSQRHTIQVDYIPYMDELAAQLGVRPRLGWLLFRDPRLGLQLLLGPCTPYQYRLCGPGQWAGARRAILTQWDRVAKPLRTRVLPETPRPSAVPLLLKLSAACLLGSEMGRRIAVIGAGATGLTCIKSCLDEGLEPVCFERSKDIGGLWRFKEEAEAERASIYRSVIINTSKEMMCYSDFPIPDHFPNYMHNSRILEYFRMYAQHFDLTRHVRFQTAVRSVKKRPDFSLSGQWEVVSVSSAGQEQSETFDGVMVCTGHHTHPHMPLHDFPGIEKFGGQYFHSWDYKSPHGFQGKRVLVIGIGNSGGDIAVEMSGVAEQVFLSTRRGSWVLNRVSDNGFPVDMMYNTRIMDLLKKYLPSSLLNWIGEKKINTRFDHSLYGLQPEHRLFSQHPMVNDDLPNRILSGRVQVKPNVSEFRSASVVFQDGSVEDRIDVVVFATGYTFSFPFLDDSVLAVADNQVSLYKYVFPPALERTTLAVIGLIQPLGAIMRG